MVIREMPQKGQKDKPPLNNSQFKQLHFNAAGIDIGAKSHYVATPPGRMPQDVREFGAFTADLYLLADWLRRAKITTVVMESTGVFWIPLFELLEQQGFEVLLVDPRRLKHVPGRKTDVIDCQWLQQLHSFGLLAPAFRPEQQIVQLRAYVRQRQMLVRYASNHIQHMQKALTQMNIKLQHVLSDITGVTGMKIVHAIIKGERDPHVLASHRNQQCKHTAEDIAKALTGNWRKEHLFELRHAVELFTFYQSRIRECDLEIQKQLESFEDHFPKQELVGVSQRGTRKSQLQFNARELLIRTTGIDLTKIDGIEASTALELLSEIGTDMSRWPSVKCFASWLGLCPGSKVTGGKQYSSRTKKTSSRAAKALRLAANSLHQSQSALGAYLRRMKARLGAPKAITATAHKLARLVYSMLKHGTEYVDKGQEYYEQQYKARAIKNLKKRAKQLGFELATGDNQTDGKSDKKTFDIKMESYQAPLSGQLTLF